MVSSFVWVLDISIVSENCSLPKNAGNPLPPVNRADLYPVSRILRIVVRVFISGSGSGIRLLPIDGSPQWGLP